MLNQSPVVFNQAEHTYTYNGKRLRGITGMISRQLFPDKYNGIPKAVLEKAATRGNMIHEACELWDDIGVRADLKELDNYSKLVKENDLNFECSEYIVSDLKNFASPIDKVYKADNTTYHLADIKTTSALDEEYVRWQLSIYAYLFEKQNPHLKVGKLYAIWLRGNESKLAEVGRIPNEVIIELLSCDVLGLQFSNPYHTVQDKRETLPAEFLAMETEIARIDQECEYWTKKRKELIDGVMKEMVKAGAYSWKGESVSFTRKKDSIRKSFDAKAFERDYPELYKQYVKDSAVKGSLILKVG